ncbi:diaminopimelate epimerase [Peptococcaceae bacterium]|nr:diaminopimelate epimerase [Peptococcaceae bacterium]MCL0052567.1 diaminopimelate epimerase [Peptococcaceae bacterium]
MEFIKMHGLGNDFVIVDLLTKKQEMLGNMSKAVLKICDRNFGVGADGLVLILPSDRADVKMKIFNPDGSEAEMCGNAIRCVAKYIYDEGIVSRNKISVETLAGIMMPEVILDEKGVSAVRVDMGEPILKPEKIPVNISVSGTVADKIVNKELRVNEKKFNITCVSMGNPHCVIFVDELDIKDVIEWGPKVETHAAFPKKTNVEFVKMLNKDEVKMQVWERGAGMTLACGTGACAVAVAAALNDLTGRKVKVHLTAGNLLIEWANNGHVYMTGPAEYVFRGELHEGFLRQIRVFTANIEDLYRVWLLKSL